MANEVYEDNGTGGQQDSTNKPGSRAKPAWNNSSTGNRSSSYSSGAPESSSLGNGRASNSQSVGGGVDNANLQQREEGAADNLYNPNGDRAGNSRSGGSTSSTNPNSSSGLAEQEKASGQAGSESSRNDIPYNADGDKQGRLGKARSKVKNLRARFSKPKWIAAGVAGGGGLLVVLGLIFLLLGALKVPNLGANILSYQFARVARNYSEHTAIITAEDTALSTADRNVLQRQHDKLANVRDKTWGSMWDKINNYRADKIFEKMHSTESFNVKYERGGVTSLWKKKITAIVINGKEIPYNSPGWKKYVHPLDARTARLEFSQNVNDAIAQAHQGRSVIIRGAVAKAIRDELHIPLKWWRQPLKYNGLDEEKANALQEREAFQQINEPTVAPSEVSQVKDAEDKAKQAELQCLQDEACTKTVVDNGGKLPGPVLSAIESTFTGDLFTKAVGFLSPTYAVGLPVCLIYDGSIANPKSGQAQTIDNNSAEQQRTFYAVETAADQQKFGDTTGEAVGAMNWKTGETNKSIPGARSSGMAVDTSLERSPQASGTGDLSNGDPTTIFSFLPSVLGGIANSVAETSCPLIRNVWFGAGTAVLAVIAGFFSGGTTTAGTKALATALAKYIRDDVIAKAFSKKELGKLGLIAVGTTALTLYAKQLVAQKAALADSGLSTGDSFANAADKGGNLNANETSRHFYGRPLTDAETARASGQDHRYQLATTNQGSVFERYLSVNNSNSLVAKMGLAASAHINRSVFANISSLLGHILNPLGSMVHLLGPLNSSVAVAAATDKPQNYGIVQWGWSNAEENLIKSDPSYQPIENQAILEAAMINGQPAVDAIASEYNVCWGYDSAGKPDPKATMGKLLADQDILRSRTGDVDPNDGLCAPFKLSYNSHGNSAYDSNTGRSDLIFRYRLEKNYEQTLDQQGSVQDATPDQTPSILQPQKV